MEKALLLFKLLPIIIQVIKAVEEAIPGKGQGEAKLAAVREMLELVYEKTDDFWPEISKLIGVLVKMFNATGWAKA